KMSPRALLVVSGSRSVRRVGNERDRPGPLDRRLQLALMERARPRDPARKDLPALGDERLQQLDVLPVDVLELLRAELADLAATDEELLATSGLPLAGTRSGPAASSRGGAHEGSPFSIIGGASCGTAGGIGAGGRGGRRAAFSRCLAADFAARFSSRSARTARCRRIWSDSFIRRSASTTTAGSAETWKYW